MIENEESVRSLLDEISMPHDEQSEIIKAMYIEGFSGDLFLRLVEKERVDANAMYQHCRMLVPDNKLKRVRNDFRELLKETLFIKNAAMAFQNIDLTIDFLRLFNEDYT